MKRWSLGLIIIGLLLIAYPKLSDTYSQWQLQRALSEFVAIEGLVNDEYSELQQVFARDAELAPAVAVPAVPESTVSLAPGPSPTRDPGPSQGVLKIDNIGLEVPIYTGTGDAQLRRGAGQIIGTGAIGEIGNAVLAGHRRTFFRNLDRLQPGDEIAVETEQGLLRYQVFKIHIVEPSDLTVLNSSRRHSVLTLITCHPLYTSKQRLIVHAYLKPDK